MKANDNTVSRRKRWPIMSKITETSNWTVMGDLRHTTVSEEWQGPPNYNRFDSEQEKRKHIL